jgi:hypothetical protein
MTQTVGTNAITGYTNLNTLIPSLADAADIAEAFRLYHFGEATGVGTGANNTNPANVKANSIAGTLISLQSTVGSLVSNAGVSYGEFTAKGDILSTSGVGNATNVQRLAVGTAGQVLTVDSTATTGLKWSTPYAQPTIGATAITSGGTISSISSLGLASATLSSPTISDSIIFEGSSVDAFQTFLGVANPTADQTITLPNATGTVSLVGLAETLLNKTLTSPVINGASSIEEKLTAPKEFVTVTTAVPAAIQYDCKTQGILYYQSAATNNFTINFRGNSSTALSAVLANTGDSITSVILNTNTGTAYYPTAFTIDGTSVTPKWSSGTVPSAGNINAIDAYTFTIIKISGGYTVLASGPSKYV